MGTEDRKREMNDHLNDLSGKMFPIAKNKLAEYLNLCSCENEIEQVFAVSEIIRVSTMLLGNKIGYDRTAQMMEALAKDLRIHEKKGGGE